MDKKATDLVISYVVSYRGDMLGHERLQAALESGYRVIDVFTNPNTVGGGGNSIGDVVVTVVLTDIEKGSSDFRRYLK
jgi:hypothetical protein